MVENDTFSYHVKKPFIDQKSSAVHSLITEERTRKLELLIHLISNSRQALVVCGPEGIGKSTLLKALQERKIESWFYCLVQGHADLSFEKIQELTVQAIKKDMPDQQVRTLSGVFRLVESQHKKIVLMIDEAGDLAPGLVNKIIEYAADHPVLRVIFVLTHDDLYVKNTSDNAIDDCHLIEIPPLSQKQCGKFLQYLATKPHSQVTFNEISDGVIEACYHETHGIPGRIIAELPALEGPKQSDNSLRILVAAVAGLVALALAIQWFSASEYNIKSMPTPSTDVQKSVGIETAARPSQPSLPPRTTQQNKQTREVVDATISDQRAGKDDTGRLSESGKNTVVKANNQAPINKQQLHDAQPKKPDDSKIVNNIKLSMPKIISPQQTEPVAKKQVEASIIQSDDKQWLKKQPIENYTLQLMVLSKEQSIKDIIKKYPQLGPNLRHIKSVVNGNARFILLYGSFTSFSLANQAKKSLPPEFRNSLARKISAIKK
jgi:DamX protein